MIWIRSSPQILPNTLRRLYHQYKPKDKPSPYLGQIKTNQDPLVAKDVVLYRYEEKIIFLKSLGAIVLFPVWSYLAYTAYNLKNLGSPDDEIKDRKMGTLLTFVKNASFGVGLGFFLFGGGLTSYWIIRTMNTVRSLILRRGGRHLTIVTYGRFGPYSRYRTVPVSHVTAVRQPDDKRMFLQVKNHYFKYQMDVEDGIFSNRLLFDRAVRRMN